MKNNIRNIFGVILTGSGDFEIDVFALKLQTADIFRLMNSL